MAESKPQEGAKKSPKKLIMIIVASLLMLGMGAAAYYFLIYRPATEHVKKSDGDEKGEQKKPAEQAVEQPEVYYALGSPLLVNFQPGSSAKIIKISVTVLVKEEAGAEVLKKHEPMIRNNLLMAISSIGADKAKTLEGKQELRAMMLSEIGKVMEKMAGKDTAKDVFFTEFVMQ